MLAYGHDCNVGSVTQKTDTEELSSSSAAICAIVKTSKLNELADLEDFTCKMPINALFGYLQLPRLTRVSDGTVDLLIWAV